MSGERYVLLGLARPRSAWFRQVAQWATSAALPAEFVKCVSADEVHARLASDRPFSAALLDGGLPAVDRDLLAGVRDAGCVPIVIDDSREADWIALGAVAVLPLDLAREQLLDVLATHGVMVGGGEVVREDVRAPLSSAWQASLVAVTGTGGSGTSTAAMALAQGLADEGSGGPVLLADLCRRAEQAMLHDARDIVPSVQELVEAHRGGRPSSEAVRALAFAVSERHYHLLLGLRRARSWPTLRPQAFEAAFDSIRRAYRVVVCDVDPDLEGEDGGGSVDVEERNVMARTTMAAADVVFVVGLPSMKGLHALVRVMTELAGFGVAADRIVPVLNRAPRSARARSALTAVLAHLAEPAVGDELPTPIYLPERAVDNDLHDGARLPTSLGGPLAGAFGAVLSRSGGAAVTEAPERVRPGSLGVWADQRAAGS